MTKSETNMLDMIARRNIDWKKNDAGRVVLICPRITNRIAKMLLKPFIKKHHVYVTLDEFGTYVWMHIDGKRTVNQIANQLHEHFGKDVEPVYDRLGMFLRILVQKQYILWHQQVN